MRPEKQNSHQKTIGPLRRPRNVLLTVRLPRELVQRVRAEARAAKRPASRQVEFFLEKVLVTL